MKNLQPRTRRVGACLLALATMLGLGSAAHAVIPTPTGFSLDISPSARVLGALDMFRDGIITSQQYYSIKYDEACDNPHLRIRARNKPALMLGNFSDSAAPITSFTLQINEGPYVFGTGDVVGDNFTDFIKNTMYTDAGVSITGSVVSPDMKTLTVNFSGLDAGKKVVFHIDLDTTDPNAFMYPDYRMVLFGAPLPGESPTTPGTASATFVNAASPAPNDKTLSFNFDQMTETPTWANENIRPYKIMDSMEVIQMGIPEPGSASLALAGAAALALRVRRRRAA
ncbi:MAG TPA: hypothetical protein PJ982_15100 [Lacipirellulaceae bacterium]|nr:hypothetical protein [Lacipirellulaceae bacterium]